MRHPRRERGERPPTVWTISVKAGFRFPQDGVLAGYAALATAAVAAQVLGDTAQRSPQPTLSAAGRSCQADVPLSAVVGCE